ncbi:MAG: archaetidylserine synthase [Methanobrevibacter sp.]|jgi:archaetidylserine synthase|nr:archaetidylserine synthase [Methanobrevibacter sp.]
MRLKSTGMGYFLAIPDAISLLNLVFGFLAILMVIDNHLTLASLCILVALVFDSVDGWVARKLERKDYFSFGKNMDSLADVVSFGAAPAAILYSLGSGMSDWSGYLVTIVCLIVLVCGMLRLARYNVIADRIQYKGFIGLPIPAAALILSTYYLSGLFNITIACILMVFASYLMISTIRFPKFDNIYLLGIGALMILILISPINIYLYGVNLPALIIFVICLVYIFEVFLDFFIDVDSIDTDEANQKVGQVRQLTSSKISDSFSSIRGMFDNVLDSVNQVANSDLSRKEEVDESNMNFSNASYTPETPEEEAIRSIKAAYPKRSVKNDEESEVEEIIVEHDVDSHEESADEQPQESEDVELQEDEGALEEESEDSEEYVIDSNNADGVRLNSDKKD